MKDSFEIKGNFDKKQNTNKTITNDHFIIEKGKIYAGKHIIIDLWNVDFDNNISTLKKIIKKSILVSKATLLHMHLHKFGKEQGISGVAVLAESHISVHTWPERNYIAFDIFMCGDTFPNLAAESIINSLNPKRKNIKVIKRGEKKIEF
jgi:S-adenosylmethionine decarboxylase